MKKILVAGLATLLAAVATPASATVFALGSFAGGFSTSYGNSSIASGAISDTFNFTTNSGGASGSVISVAQTGKDIALTSVMLDGTSFTQILGGPTELWQLALTNIASGAHTITVLGNWDANGGSYGGQLDFSIGTVPEPETWALLLAGFGIVGMAARRRRRVSVNFG